MHVNTGVHAVWCMQCRHRSAYSALLGGNGDRVVLQLPEVVKGRPDCTCRQHAICCTVCVVSLWIVGASDKQASCLPSQGGVTPTSCCRLHLLTCMGVTMLQYVCMQVLG